MSPQSPSARTPIDISTRSRLKEILSSLHSQDSTLRSAIENAHGASAHAEPPTQAGVSDPQTHAELLDNIESVLRASRDKIEFLVARL